MFNKKKITKVIKYVKKLSLLILMKLRKVLVNIFVANNYKNKKTILFFLPEIAVELYAKMLIVVAEEIRGRGYEPVFFGCNGFLNNCLMQNRLSFKSKFFKNSTVCLRCQIDGAVFANKYNLIYLDCKRSFKQKITFKSNSLDDRLAYVYKGIPVGRLAYYDLSINFKRDRSRNELTQKEILFYDSVIRDGVGIIEFLDQNKSTFRLDAVLAIDEYCISNIVREWARINSISAFRAGFSYHFNADPQFVTISSTKTRAGEKCHRLKNWKKWCDIPLPAKVIEEITDDLIFRMSGSGGHIFSSNYNGEIDEIIKRYDLSREEKTLVVFASANDEIDAISELCSAFDEEFYIRDAFNSQLEWLDAIINYAREKKIQVIIKMHPRLSQNHRDSGDAEDINLYKNLAKNSPKNVVFLWPDSNVSAYDILHIADCCLTSWGTMGLEAAKLGVPVITGMTKITFATPGLTLFSKSETQADFFRLIEETSKEIYAEDIAEAFRWHHLMHMSGAIIIKGDRDLSRFDNDFECNFSDILEGTMVEEKKHAYLSNRANNDLAFAQQEELYAISQAVTKIVKFFELNARVKFVDSKLFTRLRSIKFT